MDSMDLNVWNPFFYVEEIIEFHNSEKLIEFRSTRDEWYNGF